MAYQTPRLRPQRFLGLNWEQITTQLRGLERQQALALWHWASYRYSSLGTHQERYARRYGVAAATRRIDRVRSWLNLKPYGEG
jgi:hypothetical protein